MKANEEAIEWARDFEMPDTQYELETLIEEMVESRYRKRALEIRRILVAEFGMYLKENIAESVDVQLLGKNPGLITVTVDDMIVPGGYTVEVSLASIVDNDIAEDEDPDYLIAMRKVFADLIQKLDEALS